MATGRHDNLSSFSGISADEWMQSRRSLDDLHQGNFMYILML